MTSTPGTRAPGEEVEGGQGGFHPIVIAQEKSSELLAEGRPRPKSQESIGPNPINQMRIKVDP